MTIAALHNLFLESTGVCIDTRKLKKNEIFFALTGENFNGNRYAHKALNEGACYAIVDDQTLENSKCILVPNVLKTLQELATYHRRYLGIPIISLTGSNGKTTTKELIDAVLSESFNTTATIGNLNNHIGVPLTLLSMNKSTEIGVVEMGANHLKEIELLSAIAEPNYGYITNIGKAHLEGFGSEANILKGKTELFTQIRKTKGAVFCNAEDVKLMTASQDLERITFSNDTKSDFCISLVSETPFVSVSYNDTTIASQLTGGYNFTNIAVSIAIGAYFKIPTEKIKEAIANYLPTINRSQVVEKGSNYLILDAYNANPSSMEVAISSFLTNDIGKEKIIFLGDMFELGAYAEKEHQQIVDLLLQDSSIQKIYLIGENFFKTSVKNEKVLKFKTTPEVLSYLKQAEAFTNKHLLIKGSRGMALERIVDVL